MSQLIPLTRGQVAVVDDEDFEWLSQRSWQAVPRNQRDGGFYAVGKSGRDTAYMHRAILEPPPGFVADHINGNGLDNRRANLRIATKSENIINRRSVSRSGFRGVCGPYPDRKLYRAMIAPAGRTIPLGVYATAEEAARAYDRAAREHYGAFAKLNFPEEPAMTENGSINAAPDGCDGICQGTAGRRGDRLTANQRWILKRLVDAPDYGANPRHFGSQGRAARRLATRGLVRLHHISNSHLRYSLTDAGRAALSKEEGIDQ